MRVRLAVIVLAVTVCTGPGWAVGATGAANAAADADAMANSGKAAFQQQCALCHSAQPNDNGGTQGPNLHAVFGNHAAQDPAFSYTQALRDSHLTWSADTLERFLDSPGTVVPGTAMIVSVPDEQTRKNIAAYLRAVKLGTFTAAPAPQLQPPPAAGANGAAPAGESSWKQDAPGRAHHIEVADLPAPYATRPAALFPKLVPKPAHAQLALPPGFQVAVFASGLADPRELRVAPNGDIFVSETRIGRIVVLRPSADGSTAAGVSVFAQGLTLPSGMAFYPSGAQPRWLYVAENNRVVRYPYQVGDLRSRAIPQIVVSQLSAVGGGVHFTRDLLFSSDDRRMFVSVGSQSNVAEDMSRKSPDEIRAWDAAHGLGAAWDANTNRADVLVFDVAAGTVDPHASAADRPGRIFAAGLRNCAGLTLQPRTGALWCTVNERDMLGDNLVPDYSTRVREGAFYGWPWYYLGDHQDPRLAGARPDLAGKITVPDVLYQAHSAPLSLIFYTAVSGRSAFPRQYDGDGFAALHGSWNRALRTGDKIVRLRLHDGVPTGEYDDFLTGFIVDDGHVWGRPAGIVEASDGSLLFTDDAANLVYRIDYRGAAAGRRAR